MRVLITGAAGTLGRAVAPLLAARGDDVIELDIRPIDGAIDGRVGDVRDPGVVTAAMDGVDVVVHAAAWHGIHLRERSAREFYDLNVTGTFNVWDAAIHHRAKGVVFSSTMGVYGESRTPAGLDEVAFVHEDLPLRPTEIYGWTKVVGEALCQYAFRAHGVPSVALRFGMFVPEPFFRYGIRLLYGGVDPEDVAVATIAAADAVAAGAVGHAAFNVESPLPFAAADGPTLRSDPLGAIDRYYPGARELLEERGVQALQPITEVFSVTRLIEQLGVRPRHDFGVWLDDLRGRPDERSGGDPPWP